MNAPPLHLLVGGRRTGKTERMLELLQGTPSGLIVVQSNEEARRLADRGYGSRVVTRDQIRRGVLQGRDPRLLIDDADWLLRAGLGRRGLDIIAASFTGECEDLNLKNLETK